jgi:hypothetical protein
MATTSDQGFLTIRMDVPKGSRWTGVPIEIRDAKTFALRGRTLPGSKFGVPEGKYWVGVILPDGQQISSDDLVGVSAGESKEVELKLSDLDMPGSLEQGALVSKSVKAVADFASPFLQLFTSTSAACVRGNWLAARLKLGSARLQRERISNLVLETKASDLPLILEITGAKDAASYFAVPVDGANGRTTTQWQLDSASGQVNVKFDFHDGELNTFFDYVQGQGGTQEARSISRTFLSQAERYIEAQESPLRAALAAYVLLRANEIDGLDECTRRLCDECKWLPDGAAIRIEYLAREGRHAEAAKLIPMLVERGAPWFRSGLAYVASRARLYSSVRSGQTATLDISADVYDQVDLMALELDRLMGSLDLAPVTSVYRDLPRLM